MSDYQGEKFKEFLTKRGITVNKAAEMLGISRQAVYLFFKTSQLKRETVNKILDTFKASEVEIWGSGRARYEALPLHTASDPNDHDNDGSQFEEMSNGMLRMRIPVVPHKAFAGYLRGFKDPEYYEDLEYISIDVFKQHRGHYMAFEVKGDSMTTLEPEHFRRSVFDGVTVIGRELSRAQWQYKLHTHNYDTWIIVHRTEGILIKQIINHNVEKGIITIHSLNPDKHLYPDQDISLDDIEQIFNVVKKIDE